MKYLVQSVAVAAGIAVGAERAGAFPARKLCRWRLALCSVTYETVAKPA